MNSEHPMTAVRLSNERLIEEFEWAVRRHNDLGGGPHVLEVRRTRAAVLDRMIPAETSSLGKNSCGSDSRPAAAHTADTNSASSSDGASVGTASLEAGTSHRPRSPIRNDPLPAHDTRVLVWYRGGRDWWISKRVSRNGKDTWASAGSYCDINKVVAWRPLPRAPESRP